MFTSKFYVELARQVSQAEYKVLVPRYFSELVSLYTEYQSKITQINEFFSQIHPRAVSPNFLTSNFEVEADGFDFILLPVHEKFLESIHSIMNSAGNYYYKVPRRIGKSFTLLHTVLSLRRLKERFRVIYVNNPELWKSDPFPYILNEICWAFMEDRQTFPRCKNEDEDGQEPLQQWYTKLEGSKNPEDDFREFLRVAQEYCYNRNLTLVSFMDQENWVRDTQDTSSLEFKYKFLFNYYQNMPCVDINLRFGSIDNRNFKFLKEQGWQDFSNVFKATVKDFYFPGKP